MDMVGKQDSSDIFRRALLDSAVGSAVVDRQGEYLAVNAALCEYLGYPEGVLRELGWRKVTQPLDPLTEAARRDAMELGVIDSYQVRSRHQHASGRQLYSLVTTSALRDTEGNVDLFHVQVVDTTEETLFEETMRLLVTQGTDVMVRLDSNSVLLWVSPTIQAATGWRPEQLMGVPLLGLLHPDDRTCVQLLLQGLAHNKAGRAGARMMGADSHFHWFSMQLQPARGSDGEPLGAVAVFRPGQDY